MSTAQLRTVVACDEAGVSIVKGGGLSGRVLVMPAPATMADRADGPVRMSLHADMWTWERAHGPQALHLQRTLDLALKLGVLQ